MYFKTDQNENQLLENNFRLSLFLCYETTATRAVGLSDCSPAIALPEEKDKLHHKLFITLLLESKPISVLAIQTVL